ncbi:MAG: hypothetical protein ACREMO_03030, partial [Gemmatimonadales bacterium]
TGTVIIGFLVEQNLSGRGLLTVGNASGPFSETIIVDGAPGPAGAIAKSPDSSAAPPLGRAMTWRLGVRYFGTAVETASLADAEALEREILAWMGGIR